MTRLEALRLARLAPWHNRTRAERFWGKVAKGEGCWEWTGHRNKGGYGTFATGPRGQQRTELAHRVSWTVNVGEIPQGLLVCHRCDNPPCVRPDHLFLGTDADNITDAALKGRMHRGEKHGMAKLTEADVLVIRGSSETAHVLGERFGVTASAIWNIRGRRAWGWLR